MKTVEYRCDSCGQRVEVLVRKTSDDLHGQKCIACRGNGNLRTQISAPGTIFKGPGFFCTDSKEGEK